MTADRLARQIAERQRKERRRAEVFALGRVTAVDNTATPHVVTVDGRRMPSLAAVVVGDRVAYYSGRDPFVLGIFWGA